MQEQPTNRRLPVGMIAGLSALVVTAGSTTAFVAWRTSTQPKPIERPPEISKVEPQPSPSASVAPTQQIRPSTPKVAPVVEKTAQVYWLKGSGELVAVPVEVKSLRSDDRSETVLNGAIETLLNGSPAQTLATTIPKGTQLRSLTVKPDGIHIDLSDAFTTGGGSTSMMGRVGQVLYTATSTDPSAPVFLSVGGQPLETLGGEGLMLDQPMTRRSFEKEFTLKATP
ncbi:spore germination protein [Phormidesmis priestleyi ULC007]|uniref:Spore germination protein n=1 Tax=Phormidesmis priestleyi ULC007 TaxID=1920490 RepID=A0A2T1DGP2_9CYAN|nr:GerMN domain-containing protein [Phormidesmis priestleyi]PSB19662.1 spore germination protein [Phormidesmis priestleyi ULC007]PZO53546.1 MAG: spore germination protein [Phormidesmis priestleyi]